jgi:hydrogenase nickel incorporation protein HypB
MFRSVELELMNKIDLLPHLDFDVDRFAANLRAVNPNAQLVPTSARTGDGIDEWCTWLTADA